MKCAFLVSVSLFRRETLRGTSSTRTWCCDAFFKTSSNTAAICDTVEKFTPQTHWLAQHKSKHTQTHTHTHTHTDTQSKWRFQVSVGPSLWLCHDRIPEELRKVQPWKSQRAEDEEDTPRCLIEAVAADTPVPVSETSRFHDSLPDGSTHRARESLAEAAKSIPEGVGVYQRDRKSGSEVSWQYLL